MARSMELATLSAIESAMCPPEPTSVEDTAVVVGWTPSVLELVQQEVDSFAQTLPQKERDFVSLFGAAMIEEAVLYNISATVKLTQAAHETGWGTSSLFRNSKALYGVKAKGKWVEKYGQTSAKYDTREGHSSKYLKFKSHWWSIRQHSELVTNGRYKLQGLKMAGCMSAAGK